MPEIKRKGAMGLKERVTLLGYDATVYDSLDSFEPEEDCSYIVGTVAPQKYKLIEELKKNIH